MQSVSTLLSRAVHGTVLHDEQQKGKNGNKKKALWTMARPHSTFNGMVGSDMGQDTSSL